VTAAFTFVVELGARPASAPVAWDWLGRLAGTDAPAVLLSALLLALGERARVERTRELSFVCVEIGEGDLPRVPPHAGLLVRAGRFLLPLDPRPAPRSLGFLPREVRDVLDQRGETKALRSR
jgi:hypothetical protein